MQLERLAGIALPLLVGCGGGAGPDPVVHDAEATRDSAAAMFEAIPALLAEQGPRGWLAVFEEAPTFLMASDGVIAFPSADSAASFVTAFAPTVAAMELEWRNPRMTTLAPGVVAIAAGYAERILRTAGDTLVFGGYITGVARSRDGTWRLQQLHWSSPRSEP